ncbi:uncharacterized protein Z520_08480 [Fonsecaea multimorphosa CBS 102226]|uniref:Methyltransferase domain-containing protein n=1 Tax=Fonsecaea multimorphosa CBS 102226 TaxID=1442371 RepID=A0A0D2JQY3_9EURO|nr:uncharacterized protein Z520_08480 [Fonsecaea multimorphosa CBS 102226]KIX95772.1 hypothetical protein Z520_08480 [Fonsecaea multimorphosa CBS 102226]OAL21508.1 hypothetical protein AYO22_07904 [Fonsecaea multimorphosa]
MAGNEPAQIALDEDEGVSELDDGETTASVRSSVLQNKEQYGRRYHAYKDGSYHRPNDEAELDRLDIAHALFAIINKDRLHLAPLEPDLGRVLDLGAGTGTWAIEFADVYPSAVVVGVDISPTMPKIVPPNVQFEIDDVQDPWTYSKQADYIHCRYMVGSISDWPRLMRQCYDNLNPGGWVEFQDFDIDYYSQDGSLTEEHALRRWLLLCSEAAAKIGRTLHVGRRLEQWAKEAGFINVQVVKVPVPIGPWPKDKRLKRMGLVNWTQIFEGLQAVSLRLFLNVLGWTQQELESLLVEVRQDMKNREIHALYDV